MDLHRGTARVGKEGVNALALKSLDEDVRALAGLVAITINPVCVGCGQIPSQVIVLV